MTKHPRSKEPVLFRSLFRASRHREAATTLYERIVAQARQPAFYRACGVPDSLDGRYEMIVLHAFLVFNRLGKNHSETSDFSQDLFDIMFLDMDRSLREIGVGDLGVGKRVKRMAEAFYGRAKAYEEALAAGDDALAGALRRNLFGTTQPREAEVAAVADYIRREASALVQQDESAIMAGRIRFGSPPDAAPANASRGARGPAFPAREEG